MVEWQMDPQLDDASLVNAFPSGHPKYCTITYSPIHRTDVKNNALANVKAMSKLIKGTVMVGRASWSITQHFATIGICGLSLRPLDVVLVGGGIVGATS
jgi:hypothetical protein